VKTAITVLALLLGAATAVVPVTATAAEQGLIRLDVTIGKSQVIDLKEPFTRVSVTNPNIADVFAITPNQILVNGKAAGMTSLVAFYPGKTLFFDLVVQADLGLLGERLKQVAPRTTSSCSRRRMPSSCGAPSPARTSSGPPTRSPPCSRPRAGW